MNILKFYAFAGFAALLFALPSPSFGESQKQELQERIDSIVHSEPGVKSVTIEVETAPKEGLERGKIDFSDFDLNKDGVFERNEVGEKLFTLFDKDGNRLIDNREMGKVGILVYMPMTKKTVETVDYHDPGKDRKTKVTEEEFIKASGLIRFDKNEDGLTPLDFLGMSFNRVDVKKDGVIDLEEWKRAYADSVRPLHMEQFNYNG